MFGGKNTQFWFEVTQHLLFLLKLRSKGGKINVKPNIHKWVMTS